MKSDTIVATSRIDGKTFRKFGMFDVIVHQKRYRAPALFAGIMTIFAFICYGMNGRAQQAVLLGNVLLGIGVVLPVVYFGTYYASLWTQAAKLKLDTPKHVYTVSMTDGPGGVAVEAANGRGQVLRLAWDKLFAAYRVKGCVYLFVTSRQAFLLPDGQASVSQDELWELLKNHMGREKLYDKRR